MNPPSQHHMLITNTLHARRQSSTHLDMGGTRPPLQWIDDVYYCAVVLRLSQHATEAEVDGRLRQEADDLGVLPLKIATDVPFITPSLSGTTIASGPNNQSPVVSHSIAPTSCSSSEHRPGTSSSHRSETMTSSPATPLILTDIEKKRKSGFRNGIRRIAGLSRKRKSPTPSSPTLAHFENTSQSEVDSARPTLDVPSKGIDLDLIRSATIDHGPTSPSIRSNKSSSVWSNKISTTTKSSYDNVDVLVDHDALQRTMESVELVSLRDRQLEERQRFLQYQSHLLTQIHLERDQTKEAKRNLHVQIVEEQVRKNEKAVDDLESRQLEDELKMEQEHECEKRSILTRLRHMEAYCQNPSPPPTPIEFNFSGSDSPSSPTTPARGSVDSMTVAVTLPERKVTDKDYHNLASCYRERDAMDNLQASKINVLRGKQKRAVENLIMRKEKELERLQVQQGKEIDEVDCEFGVKEAECRAEFWEKRQVLEKRWKLQATIEKTKMEKRTGLAYEVLPILVLSEKDGGCMVGGYGIAR